MSQTRLFIVHGYTASPDAHWFPWLKAELEARDVRVEVLAMPDPHHPEPATWDAAMDHLVRDHDERTFLLGHSLGCITILRQLDRLPAGSQVGGDPAGLRFRSAAAPPAGAGSLHDSGL